jgi:gamma-glutamyl-gamma-aminobutyrate hydrolase PuuD
MHHQGYTQNEVASTMNILAIEPESGIVEAATSKNGQIYTVQFHPEFMSQEASNGFFKYMAHWAKEIK